MNFMMFLAYFWNNNQDIITESTKDVWLTFGGRSSTMVQEFCDPHLGSSPHHHSLSSYSFHMGNGAVSWSSKKQYIMALLSTEAEYIALTHAAKEVLWLCTFLSELQGAPNGPMTINCDNQGAIALSKDNKFHARTKHIVFATTSFVSVQLTAKFYSNTYQVKTMYWTSSQKPSQNEGSLTSLKS